MGKGNKKEKEKKKLPKPIRDEIRRLMSIKALNRVYSKGKMKVRLRYQEMFDIFHGNKGLNYVSLCDQVVENRPPFSAMFD